MASYRDDLVLQNLLLVCKLLNQRAVLRFPRWLGWCTNLRATPFLRRCSYPRWDPVATEDSLLVSVDISCAGEMSFPKVEVGFNLELLLTILFWEGFVTEGFSNFLGDGVKHWRISWMNWKNSSVRIESRTMMWTMASSSCWLELVISHTWDRSRGKSSDDHGLVRYQPSHLAVIHG